MAPARSPGAVGGGRGGEAARGCGRASRRRAAEQAPVGVERQATGGGQADAALVPADGGARAPAEAAIGVDAERACMRRTCASESRTSRLAPATERAGVCVGLVPLRLPGAPRPPASSAYAAGPPVSSATAAAAAKVKALTRGRRRAARVRVVVSPRWFVAMACEVS